MECQPNLNKFLGFLDLDKISDLGLDKLVIPLPISTTLLLSTPIAIRVDILNNLVIIKLEWVLWLSYLVSLLINQWLLPKNSLMLILIAIWANILNNPIILSI